MKKYPGDENEVSKKSKPMKIANYMDPKYRGIGASTKLGNVKAEIISTSTGKFYGSKAIMNKVVEDEKMKLLKSLNEDAEKVIWAFNKEDPSNSEVLVQGVGRFNLRSLKENVRNKLKDLYEEIAKTDDPTAWSHTAWKLDPTATHSLFVMIKTIVAAENELQAIRKGGGIRSKAIKRVDL